MEIEGGGRQLQVKLVSTKEEFAVATTTLSVPGCCNSTDIYFSSQNVSHVMSEV